jgi:hypothetical protein
LVREAEKKARERDIGTSAEEAVRARHAHKRILVVGNKPGYIPVLFLVNYFILNKNPGYIPVLSRINPMSLAFGRAGVVGRACVSKEKRRIYPTVLRERSAFFLWP